MARPYGVIMPLSDFSDRNSSPLYSDIRTIHLWARVAVAARCSARVLPRIRAYWPTQSQQSRTVLHSAVEFAMNSGRRGKADVEHAADLCAGVGEEEMRFIQECGYVFDDREVPKGLPGPRPVRGCPN